MGGAGSARNRRGYGRVGECSQEASAQGAPRPLSDAEKRPTLRGATGLGRAAYQQLDLPSPCSACCVLSHHLSAAYETKHAGAKNGGGAWCPRAEAKQASCVEQDRAVGLDHDQPQRLVQDRVETTGVGGGAAGDDQAHTTAKPAVASGRSLGVVVFGSWSEVGQRVQASIQG